MTAVPEADERVVAAPIAETTAMEPKPKRAKVSLPTMAATPQVSPTTPQSQIHRSTPWKSGMASSTLGRTLNSQTICHTQNRARKPSATLDQRLTACSSAVLQSGT